MSQAPIVKDVSLRKNIETYQKDPNSVDIVSILINFIQQKEEELENVYGRLYDCEQTIEHWEPILSKKSLEIEELNNKLNAHRNFVKDIFVTSGQQGLLDKNTLLRLCVEHNIIL